MKTIAKALTPEEKAIVGNIKSLLTQLEGVVGEGTGIEMSALDTTAGEDPAGGDGITKAEGAGGETGRSTAEEKIDELPVTTDEALSVLKAMLFGKSAVQKSARSPSLAQLRNQQVRKSYTVENEMLKVMKSIANRLDEQEFTLQALINGKEVAENLLKIEKAAPRVPVQPSNQAVLEALGQLIQKSADAPAKPQDAGSMRDVLSNLWA